jgi:hypothetical protein
MIRKTANVANFSGITSLILGIGALGCLGMSRDVPGVIAVVVLFAVGVTELVGRQRLLAGQTNALRILAFNQIAFLAAIGLYCLIQIVTFSGNSAIQSLNAELKQAGGGADVGSLVDPQLASSLNTMLYVVVFGVSIASQGGLAWYYTRRQKYLEAFAASEPWQREFLQKVSF